MIRIRRSHIEEFRRVILGYADVAELAGRIKGKDEPNWQMQAGTAWHKLLEGDIDLADVYPMLDVNRKKHREQLMHALRYNPPQGEHARKALELELDAAAGEPEWIGQDDYQFTANAIAFAKRYTGPGLHEVTGRMTFEVCGRTVEIEGTADLVNGLVIQDHKTKFSTASVADYEDALQWRFYLLIHRAEVFRYNLWRMSDPKEGRCEVKEVVSCRFWRYQGMEQDCRDWVRRFVLWAEDARLLRYLDIPARRTA
jgi:hypothetical protein